MFLRLMGAFMKIYIVDRLIFAQNKMLCNAFCTINRQTAELTDFMASLHSKHGSKLKNFTIRKQIKLSITLVHC